MMALQHAKSGEVVSLRPLGSGLKTAKTAAITKSEQFEAVRLIVHAGMEIPVHEVTGSITLHCLEGHVKLGLESGVVELNTNDWMYLDGGAPHSVTGIEDSSLLLTIFFSKS